MVTVSVKSESNTFAVVVKNDRLKYTREFESYEVPRGIYGLVDHERAQEVRAKAVADAADWAQKFRAAGIKVELEVAA